MDTEVTTREVRFDKWCRKCAYIAKAETDPPCVDCLDEPVNEDSEKPAKFKAASKKDE